jgi:hypothetical protein
MLSYLVIDESLLRRFIGFVLGKLGTNHHQLLELGMKATAAAQWIKTLKIVQKTSSTGLPR